MRDLGAAWGLDDPQQAARPCLLTRLAYGMTPEPALLARLAAAEADLAALSGLGDFRLRLTPEPVLQAAVLPDGLRPQVMQVLEAHGFGGAGMVEGTVSGFLTAERDFFWGNPSSSLSMPAAFCIVQRVGPPPGRCRYTKAFPGVLIKGEDVSPERIKRARETEFSRARLFLTGICPPMSWRDVLL